MKREVRSRRIGYKKARYRKKRIVKRVLITGSVLCVMIGMARIVESRIPVFGMFVKHPFVALNEEAYPKELLDMLSRNPDLKDFVRHYPEKKGKVYAECIGEVEKGNVPLLFQWDERWGYGAYGDGCVAVNGCAPTALSMVVAGLTGENTVTPYTIAKYAQENGYYVDGIGTSWELFQNGCENFGVRGETLSLTENSVKEALNSGKPIICSVRPGDFTTAGHFIVLTSVEDGKIRVNDPNSKKNSEKLWDYERLEPQIKNLWAFQKI